MVISILQEAKDVTTMAKPVRKRRRRRRNALPLVLLLAAVLVLFIFLFYSLLTRDIPPDPAQTTAGTTIGTADTTVIPDTTAVPDTTVPETTAPVTLPELTASHAIVADVTSGIILGALGDIHERIYPASITKLFTAWVALQYLEPDHPCTAGDELELVAADSSRAFIYYGQTVTAEMAVQGLLMNSGNDAAYILAAEAGRTIAGDSGLYAHDAVEVFMDEVNRQLQSLGLTGTHFVNPDGYHDDNHYTTMADLVVIAQLSMLDDTVRKYVAMDKADVVYYSGETNSWINTNLLLHKDSDYYLAEACGLKTGHTSGAGYCLLSAIRRDEGYTIIGVFGTPNYEDRFADTRVLAEEFLGLPWEPPMPEETEPDTTGAE